jgi:hypothetical protein
MNKIRNCKTAAIHSYYVKPRTKALALKKSCDPITLKCLTCTDFNFCQSCFYSRTYHKHEFSRIDKPDSVPVFAGRPGWARRGPGGGNARLVVKSIEVSSGESSAYRLTDGNTASYWESFGAQVGRNIFSLLSRKNKVFLHLRKQFLRI